MTQPEAALSRRIIAGLRERLPHSYWRKIHGSTMQRAGIPDIYGCVLGHTFGFETKMPGEKPSAIQLHEMDLIRRAGGTASVIYSLDDALMLVASVFPGLGLPRG